MNKATFSSESKATAVTATSNSNQKKIPLPPTYKEQIQEGVPFGKRKFYGREGQTYAQFSVGMSVCIFLFSKEQFFTFTFTLVFV